MPSAGQTTDEVVICRWLVAKGDKVQRGDMLLEVETDKATLSIESFAKGIVIDLLVKEGDSVDAGCVLALVGDESDLAAYSASKSGAGAGVGASAGGAASAAGAASAGTAAGAGTAGKMTGLDDDDDFAPIIRDTAHTGDRSMRYPPTSAKPTETEARAMPNAKKLATEHNVDIAKVVSANGGLIKQSDVRVYLDALGSKTANEGSADANALPDEARTEAPAAEASEYEVLALSTMRRKIGERMLRSVQTIPSFQLSVQIDMTESMKLKEDVLARNGTKISYNDIFAKAIAVSAKEFPLLNARYENDEIRVYRHCNIGLAVALDAGLIVPVAKNVESLGLAQIAAANKTGVEKARAGSLLPSDMGCGSTTISNLGMHGIDHFTAIINPPECSIFALGNIVARPVWEAGAWKSAPVMEVTASYDHRVIDGSYGARILKSIKGLLESPALMLC